MEMLIIEAKKAEMYKEKKNILILDPEKISLESIELSLALTKKSFEKKRNIASSFYMEFALWLSGMTNISSALKWLSPKGEKALIIDFNSKKSKIPKEIKKNATWQEIERISLSRL